MEISEEWSISLWKTIENYCVQNPRTCVKDNKSSLEFFERKGQTDTSFTRECVEDGAWGGGGMGEYIFSDRECVCTQIGVKKRGIM